MAGKKAAARKTSKAKKSEADIVAINKAIKDEKLKKKTKEEVEELKKRTVRRPDPRKKKVVAVEDKTLEELEADAEKLKKLIAEKKQKEKNEAVHEDIFGNVVKKTKELKVKRIDGDYTTKANKTLKEEHLQKIEGLKKIEDEKFKAYYANKNNAKLKEELAKASRDVLIEEATYRQVSPIYDAHDGVVKAKENKGKPISNLMKKAIDKAIKGSVQEDEPAKTVKAKKQENIPVKKAIKEVEKAEKVMEKKIEKVVKEKEKKTRIKRRKPSAPDDPLPPINTTDLVVTRVEGASRVKVYVTDMERIDIKGPASRRNKIVKYRKWLHKKNDLNGFTALYMLNALRHEDFEHLWSIMGGNGWWCDIVTIEGSWYRIALHSGSDKKKGWKEVFEDSLMKRAIESREESMGSDTITQALMDGIETISFEPVGLDVLVNAEGVKNVTTYKSSLANNIGGFANQPHLADDGTAKKFDHPDVEPFEPRGQWMIDGHRSILNYFQNKDVGFLPYQNVSHVDGKQWQVINNPKTEAKLAEEQCLIFCLKRCGIENSLIQTVKAQLPKGAYMPVETFNTVTKIIGRPIAVTKYQSDGVRTMRTLYGKNIEADPLELAIFENHIFVLEETKYTKYSIEHYWDVMDFPGWNTIYKGLKDAEGKITYKYDPNKRMGRLSSLGLIKTMAENGLLLKTKEMFEHIELMKPHEPSILETDLSQIHHDQCLFEDYFLRRNKKQPLEEVLDVPYEDDDVINEDIEDEVETEAENEQYTILCADYEASFSEKNAAGNRPHRVGLGCFIVMDRTKDQLDPMTTEVFQPSSATDTTWIDRMMYRMIAVTRAGTKLLVYTHNLRYDIGLLAKSGRVYIQQYCIKEGAVYSVIVRVGKTKIEFRDSLKLIPTKLSEFTTSFGLHKSLRKFEVINYGFYTPEIMASTNPSVTVKEYAKGLARSIGVKDEEREKVLRRELKSKASEFDYDAEAGTFNPIKLYIYYLRYDVLVLNAGLKSFSEGIKIVTGLSTDDTLTISSLAFKYIAKNGGFDGVYGVKGLLRNYLANAVYGGRVEVNSKYQGRVIEDCLTSDYDCTSLYPHALKRICEEKGGFPVGRAKWIPANKRNLKYLESTSYYVVTVKITSINKTQQIPFVIQRTEDGGTNTVNVVPEEGLTMVIDQTTLIDWINFHHIEYQILDGVYWDEGFNGKAGPLIQRLADQRDIYKEEGKDLLQMVIKLIMNSIYGKTLLSKSHSKYLVKNNPTTNAKSKRYCDSNFNTINSITMLNDKQCVVEKLCVDNSYNLCHVGVMILGFSKRVMNEVMAIANDEEIPIYYQDTDSLHLPAKFIEKLEAAYLQTHGRVLQGKKLGQFHNDFSIKTPDEVIEHEDGEIEVVKKGEKLKNVMSEWFIALGKKCYCDRIFGYDSNGVKHVEYHIRLKGITSDGVEYMVEKNFSQGGYEAMMLSLAAGNVLDFILNPWDNGKPSFIVKLGGVSTRETGTFSRKVGFVPLSEYEETIYTSW